MDVMTRKEAVRLGRLKYFTGKPCPSGHIAERFTSRAWCVECATIAASSNAKKQYDKAYFATNAERIAVRGKAYYEANKQVIAKRVKLYAETHPDLIKSVKKSYKHRRRAQELQGMTTADFHAWAAAQEKTCHWCRIDCADSFHVDHFFPLSKGGKHEAENLVIACPTCNVRKGAKDPYIFAQESFGRLF